MAEFTPNLGLRKPTSSDLVSVQADIAQNMDKIDANVLSFPVASPALYTLTEEDQAHPDSYWGDAGVKVLKTWTPGFDGSLAFFAGHLGGAHEDDYSFYLFRGEVPDLTAASGDYNGEYGADLIWIYGVGRDSIESFWVNAGETLTLVLIDWGDNWIGRTWDYSGPLTSLAAMGSIGQVPPPPPPGTVRVPLQVSGVVYPWVTRFVTDEVYAGGAWEGKTWGIYHLPPPGNQPWCWVEGRDHDIAPNTYIAHVEGYACTITTDGYYGHVEGQYSRVEGVGGHAEGNSHALGDFSHSEGGNSFGAYSETVASGQSSHAEGSGTKASGGVSHAEGDYSEARGFVAHAEGILCLASGEASHAQGRGAVAWRYAEHAESCGYQSPPQDPLNHFLPIVDQNFFQASRITLAAEGNSVSLFNGLLAQDPFAPAILKLTPNRLSVIRGLVAVRDANGTKGWTYSLMATMGATGTTPTIVGSPVITVVGNSAGAAAGWTFGITAATNGLTYAGAASGAANARWAALAELVEV